METLSRVLPGRGKIAKRQWRAQKIFLGGVSPGSYGGHLYLVCALCDVTIFRNFHVSKPTFWRNLLT